MACKFHPDRESVAMCVTCGAELCEDCRKVAADGKSYCPEHLPQEVEMPPRAAPEGAPAAGTGTESTGLAAACYFSWIVPPLSFIIPIVPLASASHKGSRYMRYHAWNGLFWGIGLFAVLAALSLLLSFARLVPIVGLPLGQLLAMLINALIVAWLVISIILAIRANNGQKVKIPLISDWAEKQAG